MSAKNNDQKYLQEKFRTWFKRTGAQGDWKYFYREIEKKYQFPERHYHTFHGHIALCIQELDGIPQELIEDIDSLELALMLHDCEMELMSRDNESRSAEFILDICQRMSLPDKFAARSSIHVRQTDHVGIPENSDSRLIVDIDLAIFGQEMEIFDEYEKNVRQEYAFVPDEIFKRERAKLLRHFLNRSSIFLTKYFQRKYEERARHNIRHSIDRLER